MDVASGRRQCSVFKLPSTEFKKIPGAPISYNAAAPVRDAFAKFPAIKESLVPKQGTSTGDDETYVRFWFEVAKVDLGLGIQSFEESQACRSKYFPLDKGGEFRKWFGNNDKVLRFDPPAVTELSNMGNHLPSRDLYFRRGLTWSKITSGGISVRYDDFGFIFSSVGLKGFPADDILWSMLGYMNSSLVKLFSRTISPSLSIISGDIEKLPYYKDARDVSSDVLRAVDLAKTDWDSMETSWDFGCLSLLRGAEPQECLASAAKELSELHHEQIREMQDIEKRISQSLAEDYGLEQHVELDIGIAEITLFANAQNRYGAALSESQLASLLLADTMREFISYAVGCMLGRYSLDKPGLILANQGETVDDYRKQIPEASFAPDVDNVIPILEGDWFSDDISQRFKEFLKVTFGIKRYDENLEFLENSLYPDNPTARNRKTIRDYFLKEFYEHHLKLYRKRPIYWLFSSPKGTFNALIYMHRYRPETVGKVLECLRDFREKLAHHSEQRQGIADSASESKAEKTKAVKDVAAIKKQLKELEEYEKSLFEVASRMRNIDIDLDNGVKHNYLLFGQVLRKIPGLDAKDD